MCVMDFGDIESECSSSNLFNVVHIRGSGGFSQDAQYRPRKSPRKRLKVTRTSLVIDQLKSVFWRPGDFMSRVTRTRRNWHPEFFTRYLRDNQRGCSREYCDDAISRCSKRNFVPEVPKIYSIGLCSGTRSLSVSDDLSNCGATRNFKKRSSSINRRPTIICKYWVAQSTPTSSSSTDVSFKAHTNRKTMIIDCTESTEIISKYNWTQKSNHNSHHRQLCERIEEKKSDVSNTSRNDHVIDDHSFIPNDFKDSSMRKDHKYDSFCTIRDAQIQTSSRKSLRRSKMKRRSKRPTAKKISSRRERYDNEPPRFVADDFRAAHSRSSGGRNHHEEPWQRVRVLENKRAEYINKFTAVNRQIEEITATLRETCCDGENSQSNLENFEEYFSSSDDAKGNAINWSGVDSGSTVAGGRNASKERDNLVNFGRIVGESKGDRCKSVQEVLRADKFNNGIVLSSKETVTSTRNLEKMLNDALDSVRMIKETVYSSNRTSKGKAGAKCRFVRQTPFDLDLAKDQNDELQECSIESESFDKVCLRNNFTILNNDERARDLAESLVDLEESRYCKIVKEKTGEMAILEDIKKRIDRDFDDPPAERSENDAEDFFTVSQKSSDLDRHDIVSVVTSAATVEESKSVPLIGTGIHNSRSSDAMSEHSNENSALSKYFSCARIPSLVSLTRNEDELAVGTVDRTMYDSRSNSSLNNRSLSTNLDSSLDRTRSSLECIAHHDSVARCTSPNKFLIGTGNEPDDTFETSKGQESFAEDKIREWERPSFFVGREGESGKEWRAEKRYTADSTVLETSKSSRYVGSIDSGVFSSSLIDLYPAESSSFNVGGTKFRKKRRAGRLYGSPDAVDSGSDGSRSTDDTLDREVNDVVRDLTRNLALCERKAWMKLRAGDPRYSQHILPRACKFTKSPYDTRCDFFDSPRRSSEDERIVSISTPSLLSLSDSEIEEIDCESTRRRAFR